MSEEINNNEREEISPDGAVDPVGKMQKRQVLMEDGRRYIIYYTFAGAGDQNSEGENV